MASPQHVQGGDPHGCAVHAAWPQGCTLLLASCSSTAVYPSITPLPRLLEHLAHLTYMPRRFRPLCPLLQIAKLMVIPFVCCVEFVWMGRRFTSAVVCSILVVIMGVAVV